MPRASDIAVFAHNPAIAGYLCAVVRLAGYQPQVKPVDGVDYLCSIVADPVWPEAARFPVLSLGALPGGIDTQNILLLDVPLRAADLIEKITQMAQIARRPSQKLDFPGGILDTHENLWTGEDGDVVRLTEKETAILAYLYGAGGEPVGRENLLSVVWSYAETVQTHTLETHIYRLRQKIEKDPSAPKILLTVDDGYAVQY